MEYITHFYYCQVAFLYNFSKYVQKSAKKLVSVIKFCPSGFLSPNHGRFRLRPQRSNNHALTADSLAFLHAESRSVFVRKRGGSSFLFYFFSGRDARRDRMTHIKELCPLLRILEKAIYP